MSVSQYRADDGVAVIEMDNPPVNGLGHELRQEIVAGIDRANADDAIRAIVLIGGPKAFSGGADIREFNTPKATAEPHLNTVIEVIEESAKPVIAAISGACMGGGLELALGCHYRVALADAQIALPEVKLGLLPGGGGTQRFPRVVGVETALNMIVSGTTVPADKLKDTALFDEIAAGDLAAAATAFARKAADKGGAHPRVRDLPLTLENPDGFFGFARNSVRAAAGPFPAPMNCLEAVAAGVYASSFDKGLAEERRLFAELIEGDESKALRHAFFGERAAAKIADVPSDTPTRPIEKAAVIGAGTMGGGITMNFLNAGIPVTILEMKQEALDKGLATVRKNYERSMKKGRLTEAQVEERMGLITPTLEYADIGDADIVIEAVFEDMDVKKQVFETLDEVMKDGAILATNTSTLDVDKIAAFTKRPQDVVGTHFFSPANVMRLLEVVRGKKTAKDVLATIMKLAKKIRKVAVVSGVCDGFIGNRMINYYFAQAMALLHEGALPQQIDKALEKWGMAMGPFRMSDLAGNDVSWYIRKRHYAEHPDMPRQVIADRICELGRFGQKTGKGWYDYPDGRTPKADPEVTKLIEDYRKEAGIEPRKIPDAEIVERLIFALVNEGARILEEGIAQRASDIDMVYLNGYGFPLHRGGPMLYADTVGLFKVVRRMRRFAENPFTDSEFWRPAPLLVKLSGEGKTLTGSA